MANPQANSVANPGDFGWLFLEHLNLNVPNWDAAEKFYTALGCQRAVVKIHMNCGPHTQFHLPVESPAQAWRGEVTIAYTHEGLGMARTRLAAFSQAPDGKQVSVEDHNDELVVHGPWGNVFRLREGSPAERAMAAIPTKRPNTDVTVANGLLGLVQVALPVKPGAAAKIADFYEETFGFRTERGEREVAIVGGPVLGSQRIVFHEVEDALPYTGDHFCIYIGDFEACFNRCAARDLLYVNPRFTFLDDSMTLDQARHWQAFRILDVKDGEGHDPLLVEEHEIRSTRHKFMPLCIGAENKL